MRAADVITSLLKKSTRFFGEVSHLEFVEKPEDLKNCFGTPVGYPLPAAVVIGKFSI
ncbi:hypothetical protein D3C81_2108200 [compost metagenome]